MTQKYLPFWSEPQSDLLKELKISQKGLSLPCVITRGKRSRDESRCVSHNKIFREERNLYSSQNSNLLIPIF